MRDNSSRILLSMALVIVVSASGEMANSHDGIESIQRAYDRWEIASETMELSQSGFFKINGHRELDSADELNWIVHNQECVLVGRMGNGKLGAAEAYLRNRQYSATLQQNAAGKWVVKELVLGAYDEMSYKSNRANQNSRDEVLNNSSKGACKTPWLVLPGNDDFITCVKKGTIEVTEWLNGGDGSRIAQFAFEDKDFGIKGKGAITFKNLDSGIPSRAEFEMTAANGKVGKYFMENSDFINVGQFEFPRKWRRWCQVNGATASEEEYVTSQISLPNSVPRTKFTLTGFGLPEPPGTTVLDAPFPYWLVGTIAGALLISVGFYLRNRRA